MRGGGSFKNSKFERGGVQPKSLGTTVLDDNIVNHSQVV